MPRLARQAGFVRRQPKKITPQLFLQSALLLVSQGAVSFERWAALCGVLGHRLLSKQALWERVSLRAVRFMRLALAHVLGRKLAPSNPVLVQSLGFKRVLLQDSTLIRLCPKLAPAFPSSSNASGVKSGSLRVQCVFDLMSQSFVRFNLSSYRRNDRAAALDIVPLLRAGDLVIRDLGYFVLGAFQKVAEAGAFYLSRLRSDSLLHDASGSRELDLLKLCQRQGRLDMEVRVGQLKMPARLVALKLEEPVAAERRRRALANRDKRLRPRPRELKLLSWAILITNVPKERMGSRHLARVYGLRWRIEIIFKTWKSQFRMGVAPTGSVHQLEVMIYGRLLFLAAFAQACGAGWLCVAQEDRRPASLLKLAALLADFFILLFLEALGRKTTKAILRQILYHTRYDSRSRENFFAQCTKLS